MSAAKKIPKSAELEPSLKVLDNPKNLATPTEMTFNSHLKDLLRDSRDASTDRAGTLTYGHTLLTNVVFGRYEAAMDDLDRIMDLQDQYPDFGVSATRYVQHAKSLVRALKAKRAIGKLPHVSRAKQKELVVTLTHHFDDLRTCVLNIEKIERQIRKVDLSATRYFAASLYWAIFAVFMGAVLIYALPLYAYSIHAYITEMLSLLVIFVANFIWPY